jgi:hypothetical protein
MAGKIREKVMKIKEKIDKLETVRFLIKPLSEAADSAGENDKTQDSESDILGPEDIQAHALQKDSPDNDQKIPQGVQIGQPLHDDGHVGDGKDKTAEHEKRQDEKESRHHGLLLR